MVQPRLSCSESVVGDNVSLNCDCFWFVEEDFAFHNSSSSLLTSFFYSLSLFFFYPSFFWLGKKQLFPSASTLLSGVGVENMAENQGEINVLLPPFPCCTYEKCCSYSFLLAFSRAASEAYRPCPSPTRLLFLSTLVCECIVMKTYEMRLNIHTFVYFPFMAENDAQVSPQSATSCLAKIWC